jgi:hypothetical protein
MSSARTQRGNDRAAKPPPAGEFTFSDLPSADPPTIRVDTSIGAVTLFPQRFEDIGAFSKLPPDGSPATRLRLYLPYIAARTDALTGLGEARIEETSSQQVSAEDLERIAEAYLSLLQTRQTVDGAAPASRPIVRAEGESAVACLDRRLKEDHERQMEDLKGTYEELGHRSDEPLASALADVDRQASALREIATRSMQVQNASDRGATADSREGLSPLLTSDDGIAGSDSVNRARDEEMALMRSIGIVTTQSAILVASLSETATRFLRQFAEATQRLEEAARTSARTVLIAVLITTALAAIAATAAILSYIDERGNRQSTQQWQDSVVQSMKDTSAAQAAQIKSLEDRIGALDSRLAAAPPSAPATSGVAPNATGDAEASTQSTAKTTSSKRASKRKSSR